MSIIVFLAANAALGQDDTRQTEQQRFKSAAAYSRKRRDVSVAILNGDRSNSSISIRQLLSLTGGTDAGEIGQLVFDKCFVKFR
ncbi:MAG: hypothetical protein IPI76_06185 [Chloracidobacterium sp.]|nr:hypothetical protein [Chloracidobacterium sp.]